MPTRHADPMGDLETQWPSVELMLGSLPAQHQEIIIATYFRHRTIREAARQLGLAPGTAKARLYEAMRDLSDMLATRWPGDAGPRRTVTGQDIAGSAR
jgi:DNA-directed RNA polymerase specialized sigma24 family protein